MFNCIYCGVELEFKESLSKHIDGYMCKNHDIIPLFAFKQSELWNIKISLSDYEIIIYLSEKQYYVYKKWEEDGGFYFHSSEEFDKLPTPENIEIILLFK